MKNYCLLLSVCLISAFSLKAQSYQYLDIPHRDELPSERVLYMMQDKEGFLWYATEGGGICRSDGRRIDIFRNDAEKPDLLGSNNVGCLAETGKHIIIGTYHGAYALNKENYSIRRLPDVDDKRVDDILVTRDSSLYLTSNKKIYHFDKELNLQTIYPSHWKGNGAYVSHLYEDSNNRIWATQWNGGLLCLGNGNCKEAEWTIDAVPIDIAEDPITGDLWIGTMGMGIVRYSPDNGHTELQSTTGNTVYLDLLLSADKKKLWAISIDGLSLFEIGEQLVELPTGNFMPEGPKVLHRMTLDLGGQLLVSGSKPGPFVITDKPLQPVFDETLHDGNICWEYHERQGVMATDTNGELIAGNGPYASLLSTMTKRTAEEGIWATDGRKLYICTSDSLTLYAHFENRPIAMADNGFGELWFSTGYDIRKLSLDSKKEEMVINLKDVSALNFTPDNRLWIATIYGQLYSYRQGKLTADNYAMNDNNDGITALFTDSIGRLVIVSNRYIRIYDTQRHTLLQQSREGEGVYSIGLQETHPKKYWSNPGQNMVAKHDVSWLSSWWLQSLNGLLFIGLLILLIHYYIIRRQRENLLDKEMPANTTEHDTIANIKKEEDGFLRKAMNLIEAHMSDEHYNVEQLSHDMCMSRMTFYRKIQLATGQKPTEFIRTFRLKKAAELLKEGNMSITEISYATGFSSVSYFSRCFRSLYGVSPTKHTEDQISEHSK